MPDKPQKLNATEKRFCAIYVGNGRNGTRAYMAIYPRAGTGTAAGKASLWVRKEHIAAEIDRLTQEAYKAEHMSADECLTQMARMGRPDPGDLVWRPGELDSAGNPTQTGTAKPLYEMPERVRACISSIKFNPITGQREITFWSKPAAIGMIGKHHKLLNDTVDVNVKVGFADRLNAAREKRLREMK